MTLLHLNVLQITEIYPITVQKVLTSDLIRMYVSQRTIETSYSETSRTRTLEDSLIIKESKFFCSDQTFPGISIIITWIFTRFALRVSRQHQTNQPPEKKHQNGIMSKTAQRHLSIRESLPKHQERAQDYTC